MNNQTVNDYFKHHWAKLIVFVLFTAVVSFFAPLKSFQLKLSLIHISEPTRH